SASGKGSGLRIKAFIQQEIEVVAPMPRASVSTATAVKPGFFSSWRTANLRSFITQRLRRIRLSRFDCGDNACGARCNREAQADGKKHPRLGVRDIPKDRIDQRTHHPGTGKHSQNQTGTNGLHRLKNYETEEAGSGSSERQAHTELTSALRDCIGHSPVDTKDRQRPSDKREYGHAPDQIPKVLLVERNEF